MILLKLFGWIHNSRDSIVLVTSIDAFISLLLTVELKKDSVCINLKPNYIGRRKVV